jgi:hypothetical protein
MYHAIHAFGLSELLKAGVVANVDDEHFWNLIDNTYIDDVSAFTHFGILSDESRSMKQCLPVEHQYTTTSTTCQRPTLQA